jgi:Cu2+-exporting ATPase
LIEQQLSKLDGVESIQVNYATHRATVIWLPAKIRLSEILRTVHRIGYKALPYDPARYQHQQCEEGRSQLRRLAIAGLFGMQVMMISISLYSGAWSGMEHDFVTLFRWLALLLTLPVMLFSATVFFSSAWRELANRAVGMDVPVSLGIGAAFFASVYATVAGEGEIYFDSVVMFVFLLLTSRYFEWRVRQRAALSVERLAHALPLMANRCDPGNDQVTSVLASALNPGDVVVIRPGDSIPADGVIISGVSSVDQSLLSGESEALSKRTGDQLIGGSINIENPLRMRVEAKGADSVLAGIKRMIDRAQAEKAPIALIADYIAAKFILVVLFLVVAIAIFWWFKSPQRWFEISLAALIVSCPCALSLATPAALSTALSRLQAKGILLTHGSVLEVLGRVSHVVFDKTGTLTCAQPTLLDIFCEDPANKEKYLHIAATLEAHSEHPLARALVAAAKPADKPILGQVATELVNQPGSGLCGNIDGDLYLIGSIEFIESLSKQRLPAKWLQAIEKQESSAVVLARNNQILCLFSLQDRLRPDAKTTVESLKCMGKKVILMSGDRVGAVERVAAEVGIETLFSNYSPTQKMEQVKRLQLGGARVLMVGDGVNDAPVLAAADVSIAMAGASSLAKTSADAILLGNKLDGVLQCLDMARRCRRNIGQNFGWAIGYNLCAFPAAASGLLQPWMAAVGMSVSSIIVVANALRLSR